MKTLMLSCLVVLAVGCGRSPVDLELELQDAGAVASLTPQDAGVQVLPPTPLPGVTMGDCAPNDGASTAIIAGDQAANTCQSPHGAALYFNAWGQALAPGTTFSVVEVWGDVAATAQRCDAAGACRQATAGWLLIREATDAGLSGSYHLEYPDAGTEVGAFDVQRCPGWLAQCG
jgi:hypothetical protein